MRHRAALLLVPLLLVVLPPRQAGAQFDVLRMNPSVRSSSMGGTGVADGSDPGNAFLNPAVISGVTGAFFTGSFSKLVPELADDIWILNVAAGAGVALATSNTFELRLGAGVRYSYLSQGEWEIRDPNNLYLRAVSTHDASVSITAGGSATLNQIVHIGVGLSVKPRSVEIAPMRPTLSSDVIKGNGVAFDLGVLLSADLPQPFPFRISPSIGFSVLNLGRSVELSEAESVDLPRGYRAGVGLRAVGSDMKLFGGSLETEVPLLAIAADFDVTKRPHWSKVELDSGLEIAVLQMAFVRLGYIDDKLKNVQGLTIGGGLGLTVRGFYGRFEYGRVPYASDLKDRNAFGLAFGVTF